MKKVIALLLVVGLCCGPVLGCANIQDDGTRTKTESTGIGVVGGAGLGGLLGYLIGGEKGAAIGAGGGALLGGIAGWFVGSHIADQKAEYASEEAWLDACLQQVEQANTELQAYNQGLTAEIASLDTETSRLQTAYAANTASRTQLAQEQAKIQEKVQTTEAVIEGITQEIAGQQTVLADARASHKSDEAALLEAEIAALERQKASLEEANRQLAAMSARISV